MLQDLSVFALCQYFAGRSYRLGGGDRRGMLLTGQVMLERAGVRCMLNELSSTVVFERPMEESFVRKWQLACQGDIAHVVVMPNITLDKLEVFVSELIHSRAKCAIAAAARVAADARGLESEPSSDTDTSSELDAGLQ